MDYYKLPKEKRWLGDGSSPVTIGGWDTEVSMVGFCLVDRVHSTLGALLR